MDDVATLPDSYDRAQIALDAGDFEEASRLFEAAAAQSEGVEKSTAYFGLGKCFLSQGDRERGIENYRLALESYPDAKAALPPNVHLAELHYQLGLLLWPAPQPEHAKAALAAALDHFRESVRLYGPMIAARAHPLLYIGNMLVQDDRRTEAASAFREAISAGQGLTGKGRGDFLRFAHLELADLLVSDEKTRDFPAAAFEFELALNYAGDEKDTRARILTRWGDALLDEASFRNKRGDRPGEAAARRDAVEKIIESAVAAPPPIWRLNGFFQRLGPFELALREFDLAAERFAKNAVDADKCAAGHALCGQKLRQYWRLGEAEKRFRNAISATPNDGVRHRHLADLADVLLAQESREACAVCEEACETGASCRPAPSRGEQIEALCRCGDALRNMDDYVTAERKYQQALDLPPETDAPDLPGYDPRPDMSLSGARRGLAWSRAGQEKFRSAIAALPDPVADHSPVETLRVRGDLQASRELFDEAEAAYRAALDEDNKRAPDEYYWAGGWNYFGLASVLAARGEFAESAALLRDGLRAAEVRIKRRRAADPLAKGARETEERAIVFMRHNLGFVLRSSGQYSEATQEFVVAATAYENYIETYQPDIYGDVSYFYAALLIEIFRDDDRGEELLKKSIKSGRSNLRAQFQLAKLYKRRAALGAEARAPLWMGARRSNARPRTPIDYQGGYALAKREARRLVGEALATAKTSGGQHSGSGQPEYAVRLTAADLYLLDEDYDAATEMLKAAQVYLTENEEELGTSVGRRAELDARLARAAFGQQKYELAAILYRKALQGAAETIDLGAELGNCLMAAKNRAEAERQFRKVLRQAPGNVTALIGMARICIDLGDEGARERYREAERHLDVILQEPIGGALSEKPFGRSLAEVYYLRGYVRSKASGAAAGLLRIASTKYRNAQSDFTKCLEHDPQNLKAADARSKLHDYLAEEVIPGDVATVGACLVILFGVGVFLIAQYLLLFAHASAQTAPTAEGQSVLTSVLVALGGPASAGHETKAIDYVSYIALTFGSIMVVIAGLFLPNITSLKAGPVQLQKAGGIGGGPGLSGLDILRPDNPFAQGSLSAPSSP